MDGWEQIRSNIAISLEWYRLLLPRSLSILFLFVILAGSLTSVYLLTDWDILEPAGDRPILAPPAPDVKPEMIKALLPKDSIKAIDDPQFESANEAGRILNAGERVIGLVINGEARAYPINILSAHEIVNDVVGGEPVAVTWCPLCYSALVFSRRVDAFPEPLIFGVSGSLLKETLVMYDQQTGSLWSQLFGAAIQGELLHSRLAFFPSTFTEWSSWWDSFPQSLVLSKEKTCQQFNCYLYSSNPGSAYEIDPYESYYNTSDSGVINSNIPRSDDPLVAPKERVLGIRVGRSAKAYPYTELSRQAVVNDFINEVPLLIWFDPVTQTGKAFIREVDGQTLTFISDPESPQIVTDQETGSRWRVTSGIAISGPLKKSQLPNLIATSAFSFGWYDYFPQSETFSP